jgi:hypothetical protein
MLPAGACTWRPTAWQLLRHHPAICLMGPVACCRHAAGRFSNGGCSRGLASSPRTVTHGARVLPLPQLRHQAEHRKQPPSCRAHDVPQPLSCQLLPPVLLKHPELSSHQPAALPAARRYSSGKPSMIPLTRFAQPAKAKTVWLQVAASEAPASRSCTTQNWCHILHHTQHHCASVSAGWACAGAGC